MKNNEYLNEEKYQQGKKKITTTALIILVVGLLIGGSLIAVGLINQGKTNSKYSEESKLSISEQLITEEQNLKNKILELKSKGIEFDAFTKYTDGESYDLKIITNALDPSFDYCAFDEYKNNSLTSKYCSLKTQLDDVSNDFNKNFDSFNSIPFYMFGAFIIISTCMISGSIYMFSKRREITAFTTQQVMPIAKEGIEKMTPTIGNVAKEITKGIKEGLKDEEK